MNYNIGQAAGLLVDYRVGKDVKDFLEKLNKEIIYTFKRKDLMEEIQGHPDVYACPVGLRTVLEPEIFSLYNKELTGYNVVSGTKCLGINYPEDVAYNVAVLGQIAIGKLSSIDGKLLESLEEDGFELVDVKQGYAKCSVAVVDEESIITADRAIAKACEHRFNVELIEPGGNIGFPIPSKRCGFIGGASFTLEGKLIFFGDYKIHKSYKNIEIFCKKRGVELIGIGSGCLNDYGGIVPLFKK